MMEQKKLGIFKKRPPPQQQPVDITPFLGSLHLSPTISHSAKENNKPITNQQRHPSIGGVHGMRFCLLVLFLRIKMGYCDICSLYRQCLYCLYY